jgi:type III secretion system chaperone SycN
MDWVSDTVSAFGQSIGIPDLALDTDGYVLFTLESGGLLCVQDLHAEGANDILVTVAQPLPLPRAAAVRKALHLADFRKSPAWQVQVGLRGEDLSVSLRMPRPSFVLSALEDAVQALFDFHSRVAQEH